MYLSSYLWGNQPEKLFELIDDDKKHVALLTNSADQFPEKGIIERFQQDQEFLSSKGFTSERLDLRDYFNEEAKLQNRLSEFGLVWVRGANVFVLRRAMRQSGFDTIIKKFLLDDVIVYGGFSAGACVMGSTLRGLELVDDAYITPANYDDATIWDGLNVLPYAIAPHYKSDHPESLMIDVTIQYFIDKHIPYKALRDGEAILINGNSESVIS